ncbi:MAG: phage GP46 family protein [Azonexus sp.]|jgi:phage gp46-like protein|nr:phage GP46 family protein [Azonexus sp.]
MLKLIQTAWGQFDLALDDGSPEAAVETAIYAILFTDARAPADRVPDTYDRRGWYADESAGSGLWHVRRQALTGAARREAIAMIQTALLARAPAFANIEVSDATPPGDAGSISRLTVNITGQHNGRSFALRVPL